MPGSLTRDQILAQALGWPVRALWYVTDRCNLSCPYCLNNSSPATRTELPTAECLNIVNMLVDGGVGRVALLGGEPLCREDFFSIARLLARKHISIELVTNGLLIKKRQLAALGRLRPWLSHVQLSLHRHDAMDFYCHLIAAFRDHDIPSMTLMVLSRSDLPKVGETYRRIAEAGADAFVVTAIGELGRAANGSFCGNIPTVGEISILVDELLGLQRQYTLKTKPTFKHRGMVSAYLNAVHGMDVLNHVCEAAFSEFFIRADGRCAPCCFLEPEDVQKYTTASLPTLCSLEDVWNGMEFLRFREDKILSSDSPIQAPCLKCKHHLAERCRPCMLHPSGCVQELERVRAAFKSHEFGCPTHSIAAEPMPTI